MIRLMSILAITAICATTLVVDFAKAQNKDACPARANCPATDAETAAVKKVQWQHGLFKMVKLEASATTDPSAEKDEEGKHENEIRVEIEIDGSNILSSLPLLKTLFQKKPDSELQSGLRIQFSDHQESALNNDGPVSKVRTASFTTPVLDDAPKCCPAAAGGGCCARPDSSGSPNQSCVTGGKCCDSAKGCCDSAKGCCDSAKGCCDSAKGCCDSAKGCCDSAKGCCDAAKGCCDSAKGCCDSAKGCCDAAKGCCDSAKGCCDAAKGCCDSGKGCCDSEMGFVFFPGTNFATPPCQMVTETGNHCPASLTQPAPCFHCPMKNCQAGCCNEPRCETSMSSNVMLASFSEQAAVADHQRMLCMEELLELRVENAELKVALAATERHVEMMQRMSELREQNAALRAELHLHHAMKSQPSMLPAPQLRPAPQVNRRPDMAPNQR